VPLDHSVPMLSLYSVDVELHDRSKRCVIFARPTRVD
jgi:hypothetical protein